METLFDYANNAKYRQACIVDTPNGLPACSNQKATNRKTTFDTVFNYFVIWSLFFLGSASPEPPKGCHLNSLPEGEAWQSGERHVT